MQVKPFTLEDITFQPVRQDTNGVWHFKEVDATKRIADLSQSSLHSLPDRTSKYGRAEFRAVIVTNDAELPSNSGVFGDTSGSVKPERKVYRVALRVDVPRNATGDEIDGFISKLQTALTQDMLIDVIKGNHLF